MEAWWSCLGGPTDGTQQARWQMRSRENENWLTMWFPNHIWCLRWLTATPDVSWWALRRIITTFPMLSGPETLQHMRPFDSVRSRWRSDRWLCSLPLILSSSAAVRSRAAHQTASSSVRLGPYCCTYGSIKPRFMPTTSKPLQRATPERGCVHACLHQSSPVNRCGQDWNLCQVIYSR